MDWSFFGSDAVQATVKWLLASKEVILGLAGVITAIWTGIRYFVRQLDSYKFLHRFFDDPRRANHEWRKGRLWIWWGPLSPLDRARLRAELDILEPQDDRPKTRKFTLSRAARLSRKKWKLDVGEWEKKAWEFERRLIDYRETHSQRLADMPSSEFERVVPIMELATPAELDHEDRRERVVRYFTLLEKLADAKKHNFSSFLSFLKIKDGYVAPAFLIAGLMTRFEDDWTKIINNYREVLREAEAAKDKSGRAKAIYSRELEELRSFQFNCWLLWGPSVPLCTCSEWHVSRSKENARSAPIIMQYGFGDEANCVDFMIETDAAERGYQNWLQSVNNNKQESARKPRRPGEPRHVGAIPGALIGQIRWGALLPKIDLPEAQRLAIMGNMKAEGGEQIDGRVVLSFTKRLEGDDKSGQFSNYYSAYVWVMFALLRKDGSPFYPQKLHRNLLPFFEHGNIADATTLQTIKENLVAKSLSALEEIVTRNEDDDVLIAYVGSSDHSGCGSPTRYPPLEPLPFPEAAHIRPRPSRILELLDAECDIHRTFMNPRYSERLVLPRTWEEATAGGGLFAACHLPKIVEEFVADVDRVRARGVAEA